jgi:NAD(P)-dependent dehydrogenase (short-subunit alcohol dehydrogenase family)
LTAAAPSSQDGEEGDVLDDEGAALARDIGPAATYVHDVTDRAHWQVAVEGAVDAHGKLDVLVNNAGVSIPGFIDAYSYAVWDRSSRSTSPASSTASAPPSRR